MNLSLLLRAIAVACRLASSAEPAATPPVTTTAAPVIFAPSIISGPANDGAPTFMPDGKTLYFERGGASFTFILESHSIAGRWTTPRVASFSGLWSDSQPDVSPDGSRMVFQSWRPSGATPADTTVKRPQVSALWEVRRTRSGGWGEPVRLPDSVNISPRVFKPSIAADGTLYFMAKTDDARTWRLYRSRLVHGVYARAQPLSFSDGAHTDVDPEIAPDQSFLIFSSAGRGDSSDTHERLYIVRRAGDGWGAIVPLRYAGDDAAPVADDGEAQLGTDGRSLYFTSGRIVRTRRNRSRAEAAADFARVTDWDNGNTNVWSISIAPWLGDAVR